MLQQHEQQNSEADAAIPPAQEGQDEVSRVRQTVRALVQNGAVNQALVQREAGVSAATISQFLNDRYPGNQAQIAARLSQWLDSRQTRAAAASTLPELPDWVETPTALQILATLQYCHAARDLGLVYGGAGMGKTTALRQYATRHPNVWVVGMRAIHSTRNAALVQVARVVGVATYRNQPAREIEDSLIERLRARAGLLLIDEAQHLDLPTLECLRGIHDETGTGLVLVGNRALYARLTGQGRREDEFAQLFSRIGAQRVLTRPQTGDVAALAAAWGVQGAAELAELRAIANRPGALRGMGKALRQATFSAQGGAVTAEALRRAWVDLTSQHAAGGEA